MARGQGRLAVFPRQHRIKIHDAAQQPYPGRGSPSG